MLSDEVMLKFTHKLNEDNWQRQQKLQVISKAVSPQRNAILDPAN